MAHEGLHEIPADLEAATVDEHRAIISLMEELEAVDWYHQRADATDDADLAAIMIHNRDEEKEHAAMILEWLRRRDPDLDEQLRTYLFTDGSIVGTEEDAMGDGGTPDVAPAPALGGSLGVGSLRGRTSL